MREQNKRGRITIGLDLGDRRHRFCALDKEGHVLEEGTPGNARQHQCITPIALTVVAVARKLAVLLLTPWISRYLEIAIVPDQKSCTCGYSHTGS
jgi:hypothetical protein